MKETIRSQSGVAAILSVIIIGAVCLIITKSISLYGIGEVDMSYNSEKGSEALAAADSCLEDILRRMQINNDLSADNLHIDLENSSCDINMTAENEKRFIIITGQADNYFKKISAEAEITENSIRLISWSELSQ